MKTRKRFGGDCRFYCQCQRGDESERGMLKACGVGEIFVHGHCVKGDEKTCVDHYLVAISQAYVASDAHGSSLVNTAMLALPLVFL